MIHKVDFGHYKKNLRYDYQICLRTLFQLLGPLLLIEKKLHVGSTVESLLSYNLFLKHNLDKYFEFKLIAKMIYCLIPSF